MLLESCLNYYMKFPVPVNIIQFSDHTKIHLKWLSSVFFACPGSENRRNLLIVWSNPKFLLRLIVLIPPCWENIINVLDLPPSERFVRNKINLKLPRSGHYCAMGLTAKATLLLRCLCNVWHVGEEKGLRLPS